MHLPIRSDPHPHETIPGYVLRLAELNRMYGYELLLDLGAIWATQEREVASALVAKETFGIDPKNWEALKSNPAGYELQSRGELRGTERGLWFVRLGWFCPLCFRDRHMMKGEWQFPQLPICVDHGVRLVTFCPQCHGTISLKARRKWLTKCRCGFHFEKAEATNVSAPELELGSLIRRRFIADGRTDDCHPLAKLRLGPLLRMVRLTGLLVTRANLAQAFDPPILFASFAQAAASLVDWPWCFYDALDRMIGRLGSSVDGRAAAYVAQLIALTCQGEAGLPVRKAYRTWRASARASGALELDPNGTSNIQHLRGLLHCEPSTIRQIARIKGFPLIEPANNQGRALRIANKHVPAIVEELQRRPEPEDFLRPFAAKRELGIVKTSILFELARDGLIDFQLHENYAFFSRDDIVGILERLKPDRRVRPADGVTKRILFRNKSGINILTLLKARETSQVLILHNSDKWSGKLHDLCLLNKDALAIKTTIGCDTQVGSVSSYIADTNMLLAKKLAECFPQRAAVALPAVSEHAFRKRSRGRRKIG